MGKSVCLCVNRYECVSACLSEGMCEMYKSASGMYMHKSVCASVSG